MQNWEKYKWWIKQGILNSNEEYENFNKIILTCFKDNCIGGPIKNGQNKTNSKNDEDLINSNVYINNYNNINDENNKQNLKKDFLNETIILLKYIDNICHKNQINDINKNNTE